jgi:diamine N-acetyltransferase
MRKEAKEEVALKLCSKKDIAAIQKVALQSYRETYMYLWTEERYAEWYMNKSFSTESLEEQMNNSNALFYLITLEGKEVGFLKLNLYKSINAEGGNNDLELERIYIIKEASGKGVGKAVVNEVFALAQQKGFQNVWLKSMDSSDAVFFYEKMGFEKVATEVLPFDGFKDEYRNLITMVKPSFESLLNNEQGSGNKE